MLGAIPGFPRDAGARAAIGRVIEKRYTSGAKLLSDVDVAVAAMSRWTGMPGLLNVESADVGQWRNGPKCPHCDGTGYQIVPVLVTYRGSGSFAVEKSEHLAGYAEDQILEFAAKLGPTQTIVTAARPCVCLPATHHARAAQS